MDIASGTAGRTWCGRFAPSPTSALHLGNLRTAVAAWLLARRSGRGFVVRVEDLDQARVRAAGDIAERQLRDLEALGIDWDGPVLRQSDRLQVYREMINRLDTYPCFCTRREIAAASTAPNSAGWRPYPGTCRNLSASQRRIRGQTRPPATRLRSGAQQWTVTDLARGRSSGMVDDTVLRRNDGTPAYNLAVVVDDGLQGVDQVVRARDLWTSAPRQAMIASLLGLPEPVYAHTGLVSGPGGRRLSKSGGALGLSELIGRGIGIKEIRRLLTSSLGLPPVGELPELLAGGDGIDAALAPPPTAGTGSAPHHLDAGPIGEDRPGWWSDVEILVEGSSISWTPRRRTGCR
ncbi:tRNA glutamyl-Q(34) synthetase GluQRS [Acidipropionibacterium acidipropionici]|uniref:tRNA glutamyl-Q(34) synthetase GluQRS n=1 Tax=Acidipropionibacterium acidipropionici TaxID=1748 RepID=UPI0003FEB47C|nr:tRNA glutamyl-Q(34) synthetase GluQRS [Acidipropionibacterium acidipropionici]APZ08470.1 tRNA glutamyl-Q(34) synthetase GluQRS [Acidipropionibacterium acidipropionici]AZP38216.1 tRNA glutamyl-Q(34) synthetase GluQRS [Acidipropionibacterium acidipropionici]